MPLSSVTLSSSTHRTVRHHLGRSPLGVTLRVILAVAILAAPLGNPSALGQTPSYTPPPSASWGPGGASYSAAVHGVAPTPPPASAPSSRPTSWPANGTGTPAYGGVTAPPAPAQPDYAPLPAYQGQALAPYAMEQPGYTQPPDATQPSYGPTPRGPGSYSSSPTAPRYQQTPPAAVPPGYPQPAGPRYDVARAAGLASPAASPPAAAVPAGPPTPVLEPCDGARILAKVGEFVILASEVMAGVNEIADRYKDQIPAAELERQKKMLLKVRLKQYIETKLIYADARRTIPEEAFPNIEKSIGEQFEQVEIPKMLERAKLDSKEQLEEMLQKLGTSLERRKRAFIELVLARQWMRQQVNPDKEVGVDEMLKYYRENAAEFDNPARARWQQLTVKLSKYPTRAAAWAAIAEMGNQVQAGVPFGEVARMRSDGSTAAEGGMRDWTTRGSLKSETIDRALFGLPVGILSQILEDDDALHIIRVVEREEASRTPFIEAQVDIEPKIREQRSQKALEQYIERLRETTPVWTVFDDEEEDQQQPESHAGGAVPGMAPR